MSISLCDSRKRAARKIVNIVTFVHELGEPSTAYEYTYFRCKGALPFGNVRTAMFSKIHPSEGLLTEDRAI